MSEVRWFFENEIPEHGKLILSETSFRHAIQSLRLSDNDTLIITDGHGKKAKCTIDSISKKEAIVSIITVEHLSPINRPVHLAISFTKNAARNEWLMEKATELGVMSITPIVAKRSVKEKIRTDRLGKIIISAMLQSQQVFVPKLLDTIAFHDFISNTNFTNKFIAHCLPFQKNILSEISYNKKESTVILIGPEGDFIEQEIDYALQNHYIPVSLGENRLRTETAAIAAISYLSVF